MSTFWQDLIQRQWDWYVFVPPLFSLFLSLAVLPVYERLFSDRLRLELQRTGLEDAYPKVKGVADDRGLQVAFLTGVPSFVVSIIVTVRGEHPLLFYLVLALLFLMMPVYVHVFMAKPGDLSTSIPARGPLKIFRRSRWTFYDHYSVVLVILNVVLIGIIVAALPRRI